MIEKKFYLVLYNDIFKYIIDLIKILQYLIIFLIENSRKIIFISLSLLFINILTLSIIQFYIVDNSSNLIIF